MIVTIQGLRDIFGQVINETCSALVTHVAADLIV
jgi:hypothetical protein